MQRGLEIFSEVHTTFSFSWWVHRKGHGAAYSVKEVQWEMGYRHVSISVQGSAVREQERKDVVLQAIVQGQ